MDDTTFGSFKSAKILVSELKKQPRLISKVGNFLQDYIEGLIKIKSIPDKKHKLRIALLWRNDFLERVKFHSSINTFVKNIIVAYYRNLLED